MTSDASAVAALPPIVAEHINPVNAFDTDQIVNTFAHDAYVNDNAARSVAPTPSAPSWPRSSSATTSPWRARSLTTTGHHCPGSVRRRL
jgi:hypothetical protein